MNRWQFVLSTVMSLLLLALVAGALALGASNRELQGQVNARAQYLQQSVQLESLYREIVRALAELGARNNDVQVRDLLQRHGITYTANAAAAPAPNPPAKK